MHEVPFEPRPLQHLTSLVGAAREERLEAAAARTRDLLGERTVWNVSSTATGGGVAEMLAALLPTVAGAGLRCRWLVLDAGPDFFAVTKRLHNRLHGAAGDEGDLGEAERRTYREALAAEAGALAERVRPGDVVLLHDPQTAGLVDVVREAGAVAVWRCHVGRDTGDERTEEAWAVLRPFVERMSAVVLSRAAYRPAWLREDVTWVVPPAIDPFSVKNADMDTATAREVLARAGLLAGPTAEGSTVRLADHEVVVRRRAEVLREGPPLDPATPVVVQVSRWDRLKDMRGLLEAFAEHVVGAAGDGAVDDAHLVLAGPSTEGVSDDPEGARVLAECEEAWRALPAAARRRAHLVSLPMADVAENAAMVNALQRHAAVVVQKSLVEGFGLTASEAMWKARPVVASAVGGLQDQVEDGRSGRLAPPDDAVAFAAALREVLADPGAARELGRTAREVVRDRFLPDRQLLQWAEVLAHVAASADG